VVSGAGINARIDAIVAKNEELGVNDQQLALNYQSRNGYRLTLLGFPFNTALLVSYGSSLGAFGVSLLVAFGKDIIFPILKGFA